MKYSIPTYLIAFFTAFWLVSCSGETETIRVASPELYLTAEGPLFEGANTATASWEFNLNDILGKGADEKVSLKNAKITKVEFLLEEADELPELENMVFEVTSKNTSMTRIGLYEGKIEAGTPFQLSLAAKQENLSSAFEDGKITFVGDFDLKEEEFWEDLNFSLNIVFELEVKK
ncbi:hypothetical protein [Cecembia calidifontis]|jgi:hypothetical protein|uniref:Uncharacterized protein n=1 Tax=Cecembia calidifontis TaxID=1187080 RepID=A0A4Q7P838_9BACT|nr:hypothetical protein [Cecembia calidifontis]RZS96017.1 hypothetical protein BC751_1571 [Cecembia calidifontis]